MLDTNNTLGKLLLAFVTALDESAVLGYDPLSSDKIVGT